MIWKIFGSVTRDRAALAALTGRLWQSVAGIGTLFFVVRYFTPVIQGYFQTFLSLVALQAFVELGMLGLTVVVISHEWAGLSLDDRGRVVGDEAKRLRMATAIRFTAVWFGAASLLLALIGGVVGALILQQHGNPELWLRPWIAAIALAAALLFCQSLVAVVEGANRVFEVALYRLVLGTLSSITLWGGVAFGFGLWSLAAQLSTSVACAVIFLVAIYRRFFISLLSLRGESTFNWRTDVWPMQWQLALQGIAGYFTMSVLVPVIFSYRGAAEAGRMGLSLQVVQALTALATSLLVVAMPRLGTAFAGREISRFERQWQDSSAASLLIYVIGASVALIAVIVGDEHAISAAARFLSPLPFLLLVLWGLVLLLVQCCAIYWRAQRVELLRFWGAVPGISTGIAVWFFGRSFGSAGAVGGALMIAAFVTLPLCGSLFLKSRRAVHHV